MSHSNTVPSAIILAAGKGTRLEELTQELPKSLLYCDQGVTLLERSIKTLIAVGIERITIVTGFEHEKIEGFVEQSGFACDIACVYNPDYTDTGSVLSLAVGLKNLHDSKVLVLEADILYHKAFLEKALACDTAAIMVAPPTGSGDEVYIVTDDKSRLTFLGKTGDAHVKEEAMGEFAGISYLSENVIHAYLEYMGMLKQKGELLGHYEEALFYLSIHGYPIRGIRVDAPWTEVDNKNDLMRARNAIMPILRQGHRV